MRLSLGATSLAFFLLSALFLVLLTLFEASMVGLSAKAERTLSLLLLVVPAIIGIVFGVLSIRRNEFRRWLGILGILSNALFALFHLFLLSFAG